MLVSGAAGATGSVAGQIARIKGCRVVGIAGGPEKCRWLTEEARFDAAIDYKAEDVGARLDALCPKGIDMVFENVGGPVLDLLLDRINERARIALCGMVASYNDAGTQRARALMQLVVKAARIEGFLVRDYFDRHAEISARLQGWLLDGSLKVQMDILDGLDNLAVALRRMFHGENRGVQLLRLSGERL